ncbi:kxDL motif-containing protein [Tropilaelaps mercedesae]|uniref:KxDL motif-containing protein n=1 Tax=Tropilaelaps mercedesae TaxID=418985 RepID=A0A1V9XCV9_9ACAR|nr:kxDL motif-containing protein [Tropilaelaps mercedesae]
MVDIDSASMSVDLPETEEQLSASQILSKDLAAMLNVHDIDTVRNTQKVLLERFEKSNCMLATCNGLSQSRLAAATKEISQHVTLLQELKKDLENVFSRIRFLKSTLANQYPDAFANVKLQEVHEEDEGEE